MKQLKKGIEPNSLQILVENVDVKAFSQILNGIIENGIILKFGRYNLEDVLCQILEDYSKQELIKRIKAL